MASWGWWGHTWAQRRLLSGLTLAAMAFSWRGIRAFCDLALASSSTSAPSLPCQESLPPPICLDLSLMMTCLILIKELKAVNGGKICRLAILQVLHRNHETEEPGGRQSWDCKESDMTERLSKSSSGRWLVKQVLPEKKILGDEARASGQAPGPGKKQGREGLRLT